MKKIVFINLIDYVMQNYRIDCLGILSLATILKDKYDVEVLDFQYIYSKNLLTFENESEKDMENIKNFIISKSPNLVCIYTMCNTYYLALILSKALKEYNKDIKIIFGGPQASLTATETLKSFHFIDAIGVGEGESTIEYLVHNLLNNIPLEPRKGIAYLNGNEVFNGGIADVIKDLDTLKYIDYSFLPVGEVDSLDIDVGRGCPFGCSFCSTKTFWSRKFRLKTPKRIVDEIKHYMKIYNIDKFSFTHDLFTFSKKSVLEFCDLVLSEDIKINWTCSSRVDTLDDSMIEKMAQAGCRKIFLGIETGSKRMQRIVCKNLDITKVHPVVDKLRKENIEPTISFIYGFPDENEDDLKDTLNMINKLFLKDISSRNRIQLHRLTFFAGTEMTSNYIDQLNFSKNRCSTMLNKTQLSKDELETILNNKEIFPQYFDYQNQLRDSTFNLEKFLSFIYLDTYKYFKYTYMFILNHYNNDLLEFFYDFERVDASILEKLTFFSEGNAKILFSAVESIKNFITLKDFNEYDSLIKDIFKFEYNLFQFMYNSKEREKVLTFNNDIYNLMLNKECTIAKKDIKLKLLKNTNNNVTVLNVS